MASRLKKTNYTIQCQEMMRIDNEEDAITVGEVTLNRQEDGRYLGYFDATFPKLIFYRGGAGAVREF